MMKSNMDFLTNKSKLYSILSLSNKMGIDIKISWLAKILWSEKNKNI